MKEVGIIGFGSFGRFLAEHLAPHFSVSVHDRVEVSEAAGRRGVTVEDLVGVASRAIIILAVPVQDLEGVLQQMGSRVKPGTLVIDVCSVKVKPLRLMKRYLGADVEIVGTHPMFGPQSGREGIRGLKVVLCPERTRRLDSIRRFLREDLGLQVLEMRPQHHDAEMAYIQGLTHWIARALREIKIPDLELSTPAYRHLLRIEEILREDSLDLFVTIERENPYASAARRELLAKLAELEKLIGGE